MTRSQSDTEASLKRWAVLTPEYPPMSGGVADYTEVVARGLVAAGDDVTVNAPGASRYGADGIAVRGFGAKLTSRGRHAASQSTSKDSVLLVQYVPLAFGESLRTVHWLRAQNHRVWVMFHELWYPSQGAASLKQRLLAFGTRHAAAGLLGRAERVFFSSSCLVGPAQSISRRELRAQVLPVPSSVLPSDADLPPNALRARHALRDDVPTVGYFGAGRGPIARDIVETSKVLLRARDLQLVLIGSGGKAIHRALGSDDPRIVSTGAVSRAEAANFIAVCDVLVFPFPDGISTRRGSAMAGLAFGRPVVAYRGVNTEALWDETKAVALCEPTPQAMARDALSLLDDVAARQGLEGRALSVYERIFDVRHTVDALRAAW